MHRTKTLYLQPEQNEKRTEYVECLKWTARSKYIFNFRKGTISTT